jgi:chemosensory pili system protein ChpA (sensor histidine kinase/response regulator)
MSGSSVGGDELSLEFAPDINPMLVEAFLEEAPQHATRLVECISRIAGGSGSESDITQAQRVAHSLKGSANLTGVRGIANLTHHLEDLLDYMAETATVPTGDVLAMLVDCGDCVAEMVDALAVGGTAPPSAAVALRRAVAWRDLLPAARSEDAAEVPAEEAEASRSVVTSPAVEDTLPSPASVVPQDDGVREAPGEVAPSGASLTGPARRDPSPSQSLRVPTKLVDNLLKLAGELAVTNIQAQGSHQRMMGQATTLREQYHLVQQRLLDMQDMVEIRGVPSGQRRGGRGGGGVTHGGTLVQGFDPLELDEYNELHSKYQALAESVTDFCEIALGLRDELLKLDDTIVDQQRISKDVSDAVLSARMVAVGVIEQRLQRGVRETCRATDKQANLRLGGAEILVDGDVLNALVDPLLHVIRNAIDHGIETPEQRVRAGKPIEGQIELEFSREGDNVMVQCRDDGRGFDVHAIQQQARARGLLTGEEDGRTDREIYQYTVLPGFSTRRDATQVSGRGIGMDVVNKTVAELKGSLDITSTAGRGAVVSMRVPLTLISMHVLLVRAGQRVFGIPSGSLQQVLFSDAGSLQQIGADYVFTIEDSEYAVRFLSELVGQQGTSRAEAMQKVLPLLLLDADAGPTAVFVDAAVDGRYLVVKTLGEMVPKPEGVVGASILGDGSVAPVLDLRVLLRRVGSPLPDGTMIDVELEIPEEPTAPEVLIVDDSLTARRMLSITIGDGGYRVRTANDGLDAIEAMEDALPDLVVTDLEMPRMNGLELAAHLRTEDRTRELPVLMVTSRSTDKHRVQAESVGINGFITKPYSNEDLLSSVRALLARADA